MKKKSVYFSEMNRREIEAYLKSAGDNSKVLLPVGATEQHALTFPSPQIPWSHLKCRSG